MTSVRELTRDLAVALDAAGRSEDALRTFRQALKEDGDVPETADLYDAIGAVCARVGDREQALDSYVLATIAQPSRGGSAERALAILDSADVAPGRTAELAAAVGGSAAAAQAHRLLGRLARRAGDVGGALTALYEARQLTGDDDRIGITSDLVNVLLDVGDAAGAKQEVRAFGDGLPEALVADVLLANGDLAGAREHAERAGEAGRAVALLTALGAGDSDSIEPAPPAGGVDVVAATVAVYLAQGNYDAARKVLAEAGSVDGTGADDFALMHAQVLLEGAGSLTETDPQHSGFADVDEARRVIHLLRGSAEAVVVPRWLRAQAHVRGSDDRFRYAWAEMLAGLVADEADVSDAIDACPRLATTLVQDAALDELRAARSSGAPEEVAAALEQAGRAVDGASDAERAWEWMTKAEATHSTLGRRLAVADLAWRTSYELDGQSAKDRIGRGLDVLDAEHGDFSADAGVDAAYTYGLLVARKAELAPLDTPLAEIERAAPAMLAAMMAEDDRYRALYAVDVLRLVGLHRSAWHAAQRCLELSSGEDPVPWYAAQAVLVAGANYMGEDVDPGPLLDGIENDPIPGAPPGFAGALRLHFALVSGVRTDIEAALATRPQEGSSGWQRWEWLVAMMLTEGVGPRRDDLRRLVEEPASGDQQSLDWDTRAEAWRLLGDLDQAAAEVAAAVEHGLTGRRAEAAINDLVRGAEDAEGRLTTLLAERHAPGELLGWLNVSGPLLVQVWPQSGAAVTRSYAVARARLAELRETPPPLEDEIGLVPGAAGPDEVSRVLLRLLEQEHSANPADVLAWAAALREVDAQAALGPALIAAAEGVEQRVGARLGLSSPAPDPAAQLVPNPIAVELGGLLVDHVDPSKPQGEGFIADQVEALRQDLFRERGVVVPGIRFRPGYIGDDEIVVQVQEVPVLRRRLPVDPATLRQDILATVRHGVVTYLARIVGPDAIDRLVEDWSEVDAALVGRVLTGPEARLRLTWIVQAALHEGLSVADWPSMLKAIEGDGGMAAPVPVLAAAVSSVLRSAQPPPAGEAKEVPEEVAAAFADGTAPAKAQHGLLVWLRDVATRGRPAYVVAPDDLRDTVAAFARTVSPSVTTYARSEVPR